MKKCPFCAEEIQNDAIKCKHCGEYLQRDNLKSINSNNVRNKNIGCLPSIGILIAGIFIFILIGVFINNPNISNKSNKYNQVKEGMTKEQVKQLLGEPERIIRKWIPTSNAYSEHWIYGYRFYKKEVYNNQTEETYGADLDIYFGDVKGTVSWFYIGGIRSATY